MCDLQTVYIKNDLSSSAIMWSKVKFHECVISFIHLLQMC